MKVSRKRQKISTRVMAKKYRFSVLFVFIYKDVMLCRNNATFLLNPGDLTESFLWRTDDSTCQLMIRGATKWCHELWYLSYVQNFEVTRTDVIWMLLLHLGIDLVVVVS
jgi:hypothetical protein